MCSRNMSKNLNSDSRIGTTASFLIPGKRFNDYRVCVLLKSKGYLCKDSVKYISLEGVETDNYFIYDQQQNVIRLAHKKYFCKTLRENEGKCKVISERGLVILVIHFVKESYHATHQGLFSFISEVKGMMTMLDDLSSLKDKIIAFAGDNGKDCIALICDLIALFGSAFSEAQLTFSSLSSFLLNIVSIVLRVSSLKDKFDSPKLQFDFNLDSLAWFFAGVGLPSFLVKRIKAFNDLTGKRVFDSDGVLSSLFDAVDLFLSILKWLSEFCDPFGVLSFLHSFLVHHFSFMDNFRLMRVINALHFKWARNSQVMLEPAYRQEVLDAFNKSMESMKFREFVNEDKRRMNKVIYDSFVGNIVRFVKSFDSATRLEPACIIFEGTPGCGKSVLMGNLTKVLSSPHINMSVYSHIIPSLDSAKDFYDDYEGQDVMVVDDIGQQGVSQWRTIINMVSSIKMGLDCAAADKKNTKFFTSKLILGTSNMCHNLHGLTKNDGISDIGALYRRIHDVRMSKRDVNGKIVYKAEYFKFDEVSGSWVNGFLPKWQPTAAKFNIPVMRESDDPLDILQWSLSLIKMVMCVNEDTMDVTGLTEGQINWAGDYYAKLQAGAKYDVGKDEVKFEIQKEETWQMICKEYFLYVKQFLRDSVSKFSNIVKRCMKFFMGTKVTKDELEAIWSEEFGIDFSVHGAKLQCVACQGPIFFVFYALVALLCVSGLGYLVYSPIKNWLFSSDRKAHAKRMDKLFGKMQSLDSFVSSDSGLANSSKHVRYMEIRRKVHNYHSSGVAIGQCIVSGKRIFTNAHYFGEDITVSLARNWECAKNNTFELEHAPCKVVSIDLNFDWMVLEIQVPCNVYPLARSYFNSPARNFSVAPTAACFVTPESVIPLRNEWKFVSATQVGKVPKPLEVFINMPTTLEDFKTGKFSKVKYTEGQFMQYGISEAGLCGCPIVDNLGCLVGLHFAGTDKFGMGMVYSSDMVGKIKDLLLVNYSGVDAPPIWKDLPDGYAGMRLDASGLKISAPMEKTNLTETGINPDIFGSELLEYGLKVPPVFVDEEGKTVLQKMGMKSFGRTTVVASDELEFARTVVESMLPDVIYDLSREETAFGCEGIAGLNKDSVNGYGYLSQDKRDYFDFDNKVISKEFNDIMDMFEKDCVNGTVKLEQILAKECLKDELRPVEKSVKPRTFRIMPLHHIFATKLCLGNLMKHIVDNRWENGICIGFNPYVDFDRLYKELAHLNCFDGDFGNWDGGCNPLIQDMVNDVVFSRYKGNHKEMLRVILDSIVRNFVLMKDALYLTTHSMPSGSWVTALFNSLINRSLTAICYYRNCKRLGITPKLLPCLSIRDFVIGDDKIVGVPKCLKDVVNAFTMKELAESLNMRYTDGTKGEITSAFKPLNECVFVKRNFRYHTRLNKMVGALSLQTLMNTVLWYDQTRDASEVMDGKFTVLQFESYLHERQDLVDKVELELKRLGYPHRRFSESTIKSTMTNETNVYWDFISASGKLYQAEVV
jgi:hypothetical protein